MGEEEENKEEEVQEEEDDDEGEEGRDWQRQRVDEVYNEDSEENLEIDNLEVPRELNFEDNAGAPAANNQGCGGGGCAGAPQGRDGAANNQGHGGGGQAGEYQGPAAAAQGCGGGGRAGAPQGPAAADQGRGGGGCAGAPQGPAAAALGCGGGGHARAREGGGCAGAPQGPAGAAGAAAAVNLINHMETPFHQYVNNHVEAYASPFNDPTREDAMRSAGAHVISLQPLVNDSNEERQKGEYMVCVILAITNAGTAQTRGRTNGRYVGPQKNTPYQQMFQCMCINSNSGRNAFTMFFGESTGGRMFHGSMEQRDNGTFSENLCVCF